MKTIQGTIITLALASLSVILLGAQSASAQASSYQLNSGQAQNITAHNSCARIENNTGKSLFIPTNTAEEWNAFKNNPPAGVSVTFACGCAASGGCAAANEGATCTTYAASSVTYPASCSSRTSTCVAGSWSVAPYSYGSCSQQYTYSWNYNSWGSCSATCGGGTQTRSVWCERSDGATVSDGSCSGTKPATSQSCNTQACYTYSWSTGGWSSCSATCNGTQTRSVTCKRSDGTTVSDGSCSGTKPATSQSCNGSGTSCQSCNGAGCNSGTCSSSGTSCPAQAPTYCWSSPGGCIYGTTNGAGICTAQDPSYYGQSCSLGTSAPNACGQTQACTGTRDCSNQCSGTCNPPPNTCTFNWQPVSCGGQWYNTYISCGYDSNSNMTRWFYDQYHTFSCVRSTDGATVSNSYCGGTPPQNATCSRTCSTGM